LIHHWTYMAEDSKSYTALRCAGGISWVSRHRCRAAAASIIGNSARRRCHLPPGPEHQPTAPPGSARRRLPAVRSRYGRAAIIVRAAVGASKRSGISITLAHVPTTAVMHFWQRKLITCGSVSVRPAAKRSEPSPQSVVPTSNNASVWRGGDRSSKKSIIEKESVGFVQRTPTSFSAQRIYICVRRWSCYLRAGASLARRKWGGVAMNVGGLHQNTGHEFNLSVSLN